MSWAPVPGRRTWPACATPIRSLVNVSAAAPVHPPPANGDPLDPRPFILGQHTDTTLNDSLLDHVWKAPSKGWWACFAAALAMLG